MTRRQVFGFFLSTAALVAAAGCGGGGGGSVTQVPGGPVPAGTRALLVGSSSDTNAVQLSQSLVSGGYRVDFAPGLPADTAGYKVVIIDESAQISQGSAPAVQALLAAGQGLVLLGRVPAMLATGSRTLPADTTSISLWFGGVSELSSVQPGVFGNSFHVLSNGLVKLPAGLSVGDIVYFTSQSEQDNQYPGVSGERIGANTAQVIRTDDGNFVQALAYLPPNGGRVYWQWSGLGTTPDYFGQVRAALLTGTRWAAGLQR